MDKRVAGLLGLLAIGNCAAMQATPNNGWTALGQALGRAITPDAAPSEAYVRGAEQGAMLRAIQDQRDAEAAAAAYQRKLLEVKAKLRLEWIAFGLDDGEAQAIADTVILQPDITAITYSVRHEGSAAGLRETAAAYKRRDFQNANEMLWASTIVAKEEAAARVSAAATVPSSGAPQVKTVEQAAPEKTAVPQAVANH